MRPEDFSPGNTYSLNSLLATVFSFNEAGGFLPRKHVSAWYVRLRRHVASMRPEDFSPGNTLTLAYRALPTRRFNEAGGFLPRKPFAADADATAALLWLQ